MSKIEVYNIEQLIKVTLHEQLKHYEYRFFKEERYWFKVVKTKEGFYQRDIFTGWKLISRLPSNLHLIDGVVYYKPHIDFKFSDGSVKTTFFETVDKATLNFNDYRYHTSKMREL